MGEDYGRFSTLGCQFGATLVAFAFAGLGLDHWLGTSPWLLLLAVFAGFAGGTYALVLEVGPTRSQKVQADPTREAAPGDTSPEELSPNATSPDETDSDTKGPDAKG